jgi:hypothetical protein
MRTDLAALSAAGLLTLALPTPAAFAQPVAESTGTAVPAAGADPAAVERRWRGTLAVGTTAVAANNVLPAPIALGAGLLVERDMFGVEGAIHVDGATICDNASGGDGSCGLLWIWDIAPRVTVAPTWSWSPYVAARFQLTSSRPHGLVPAAGPRVGVRYRGANLGCYFEAGPSFVSEKDGMFGEFVSGKRWFPQISTGIAFNLW